MNKKEESIRGLWLVVGITVALALVLYLGMNDPAGDYYEIRKGRSVYYTRSYKKDGAGCLVFEDVSNMPQRICGPFTIREKFGFVRKD